MLDNDDEEMLESVGRGVKSTRKKMGRYLSKTAFGNYNDCQQRMRTEGDGDCWGYGLNKNNKRVL